MAETIVGIRELKAELSSHMRSVKTGGTILITEHGNPVGRIVPVARTLEERVQRLAESGIVEWNGQRPGPPPPRPKVKGRGMISDLLLEDRE